MQRYPTAPFAVAGVVGALVLSAVAAGTAEASAPPSSTAAVARAELRAGTLGHDHGAVDVCAAHHLACNAVVVTTAKGSSTPLAFRPPVGYGARDLEDAYGITGAPSRTGTIVVIGAGAYPTLESDLAIYRRTYNLPDCTSASGCFQQLNFKGGAPYKPTQNKDLQFGEEDIAVETSLDVDMASAACPKCHIISMQVPLLDGFYGNKAHIHQAIQDFADGVRTAHRLGASAVSISYGYPTDQFSDKGAIASELDIPGMAIVSSSGDSGFTARQGQWPQSLSTVTSAGGTSLYPDTSSTRGYTEVAWNGAGSDCTKDVGPAVGQPASVSRNCQGKRAASDVSAVADPYTGVAVYDSYAPATGMPLGFIVVGGTSVASPFLGGLYARAPQNDAVHGPNTMYAAPAGDFTDVTTGTNAGLGYCRTVGIGNAVCDAGPGWDGPTGVGTPYGLDAFSTTP
jgi:subtilase family serine protease